MDTSVQRVQPEPVLTGRQKRQQQRRGEEQPQFPLEPQRPSAPTAHIEPHSPNGDGLGEKLDVIA